MKSNTTAVYFSLLLFGLTGSAYAGGLYLYEIGTEDLGLAGAGMAARAQDASTVMGNPAGMTRLNGKHLTVGAQVLYGDFDYTMANSDLQGPGNVVGWMPGLSSFYTRQINEKLTLGLGLFGNYGLGLSFDDSWAGRYLVKDATLLALTMQPTAAYRFNDQWSVGAGLGMNMGFFSLKRDQVATGTETEGDDTDLAFNGRFGILWTLSENTRLGLTYAGEVDYDFDVDLSGYTTESGTPWMLPLNAAVAAPQQVMFSFSQTLTSEWALLGNIGWQDWSTFSELALSSGGVQTSPALQLDDTYHLALGLQYQFTEATRINFGLAYDTSMYEDQDYTSLTLISGAAWRFGTGVQHQLSSNSSIGIAVEYLAMEDAHVASPAPLKGSYSDPRMFFMGLNYSYTF